jgi:hypothetical protein
MGSSDSSAQSVKFGKSQLESFLTGKTYPIGGSNLSSSKGALYFGENGDLLAEWEGQTERSSWSVEDGSQFCYELQMFGGSECVTLLKNPETGGYVHVYEGERRNLAADAIVEGNQI